MRSAPCKMRRGARRTLGLPLLSLLTLGSAVMIVTLLARPTAADHNGLHPQDLTDAGLTPAQFAQELVGPGVTIDASSATYTGHPSAAGTFTGGGGIIGFESGIILSSGNIASIVGPNESPNTTGAMFTDGDDDLSALSGFATFDAAVLEFDFEVEAGATSVSFNYVFGSEEYNEYVGSQFNDVFAFFVNGDNCAVVPDPEAPGELLPVSVNTINNGQPGGPQVPLAPEDPVDPVNPHLYINNDPFHLDSTGETVPVEELLDTEMDGLTVVLTCEAAVTPGVNTMKLAIADASDRVVDSWVLIEGGSLAVVPTDTPTASATATATQTATATPTPSPTATATPTETLVTPTATAAGTPAATATPTATEPPVTATPVLGVDGCGPGFWKTHPTAAVWGPAGHSPGDTVSSVFAVDGTAGSATLLQALDFRGGRGIDGAERILMRAAVSALLNASHLNVGYAFSDADVISLVQEAVASNDRRSLLELAGMLDDLNNGFCPIDAHGNPITPAEP